MGRRKTHLVSGISVLQMYCSTRGARFIPLTELEKYCLYTFSECKLVEMGYSHLKNVSLLKWDIHMKKIVSALLIVWSQVVPEQEVKHRLNTRHVIIAHNTIMHRSLA